MIRRHFCTAPLTLLIVCTSAAAWADWWEFPRSVARDCERRQAWPQPFVVADQESVYAPFDIMVANGWRRQNTLADYHFDQDGQLTEAGRLKVQWIVLEAAPQHRAVFVHRGLSAQETATRLNLVQQYVLGLVGPNMMVPPVLETVTPAPASPADHIDAVNRLYLKSTPDPRLPQSQGTQQQSK